MALMEAADDDELYFNDDYYDQPSCRTVSRMNTSTWDSGSDSDSGEEAERFLDDVCREVAANQSQPVLRVRPLLPQLLPWRCLRNQAATDEGAQVTGRIGDPGISRLSFAFMHNNTVTSLFLRVSPSTASSATSNH